MIASARQTNEELYLLAKLAKKLGALTDSVPRLARRRQAALECGPESEQQRRAAHRHRRLNRWDRTCRRSPKASAAGAIKTLIVFGEDVTRHGLGAGLLGKLETLIVSDILPNETTRLAHYLLPGCAHAEKRGTFTNTKGRVQKFMKAVEPPGDARPEWEFLRELVLNITGQDGFVSIEGLFNQMAGEIAAFNGLTWAGLGDTGATVQDLGDDSGDHRLVWKPGGAVRAIQRGEDSRRLLRADVHCRLRGLGGAQSLGCHSGSSWPESRRHLRPAAACRRCHQGVPEGRFYPGPRPQGLLSGWPRRL